MSTKDQTITLHIMKSYDLTRKVHRYESYSILLLFIKAQTERLLVERPGTAQWSL